MQQTITELLHYLFYNLFMKKFIQKLKRKNRDFYVGGGGGGGGTDPNDCLYWTTIVPAQRSVNF